MDAWELLHAELGTTTGLWGNGGESAAGDVAVGSTGEPGTEDSGGLGAVKNVLIRSVSENSDKELCIFDVTAWAEILTQRWQRRSKRNRA